jgi:hypothetical protein
VTQPRIKGSAIRELVRWYARTHGMAGIETAVRAMPQDLAKDLDLSDEALGILSSGWYDVRIVHALLDALVLPFPPAERRALLASGAREAVRASASGVYRFVIAQIVTPGFYARNIQRLWRMLHESGHREILIEREGHARSRTWDWPGHHPLMCDVTIETMCAVFELTGREDVVAIRRSCVSDGARECVVDVRWRTNA